ncbi:MAG: hypothetical protein AAB653_03245, partial [Patescibacteria group bacterium]
MKKNIIFIAIIGLLVFGAAFYFWKNPFASQPERKNNFFEFNNYNSGLTEKQVNELLATFTATKQALASNPEDFDAWLSLGGVKKTLRDYQGAEEIWLHLSEIRPVNSLSFNNLGDLYA